MSDEEVRITIHRWFGEPKDFTLRWPLQPEEHEMLQGIYDEFTGRGGKKDGQIIEDRMHPRLPRAVPGRAAGWLSLAWRVDACRWRLSHWPGSGLPGHHDVPGGMGPEHLARQEYLGLRIDEHGGGYQGALEKSVAKGTRSDVVALDQAGKPVATFEVQITGQSGGTIVRRDRAVTRAGVPASWLGVTSSRPAWANKVPWLGANRREGMARGSWTVASGHRAFGMERCEPGARQSCEVGRNWCGDEHPYWEPRGGVVDDIVDGIIAGDLQRFDTGKALIVATPADCQRYIDHYQSAGAKKARRKRPPSSVMHNGEYPESKLMASGLYVPTRQAPQCLCCDEQKWSAAGTGICLDCDWGEQVAPAHNSVSATLPVPAIPNVATGQEWALHVAQRAAVDMARVMNTYQELLNLWDSAKHGGTATPQLFKACQRRAAQIFDGPR